MKWDDLLFRGLTQAAKEWQRTQRRQQQLELRSRRKRQQLELRETQRAERVAADCANQQRRVSIDRAVGELSDVEFEAYVAGLFEREGWRASLTRHSGDEGVDIELLRVADGKRAIAQCKKWKGNVGQPVVRDLYGAMMHAEVDEAYIVTPSGFTQAAVSFSSGKPIHLIGGPELLKWVERCRSDGHAFSSPSSPLRTGNSDAIDVGAEGIQEPGPRPVEDQGQDDEDLPTPQFVGYCREMLACFQDLRRVVEDEKSAIGGAPRSQGRCISSNGEYRQLGINFVEVRSSRMERATNTLVSGVNKCNVEFDAANVRANLAGVEGAVRGLALLGVEAHDLATTNASLRPVLSALQDLCPAALEDLDEMFARLESPFRRFLESPNTAIQRGILQPAPTGGYRFAGSYDFTFPRLTSATERVRATLSLAQGIGSGSAGGTVSGCLLPVVVACVCMIAAALAWARA